MADHTEKLNLELPDTLEYYDITKFNENFKKLDKAIDVAEDNQCVISEDGNIIVETYGTGKRVTEINVDGSLIVESTYDEDNNLVNKVTISISGNQISEVYA